MKAKLLFVCVTLIAGLLLAQTTLAKGVPMKVTISGAGLLSEIVVLNDEDQLRALASFNLESYSTLSAEAPEGISGDDYLITRYMEESPGRLLPFDSARYFPDPAGGRGYVYYIGMTNGSSEYDNRWFRANADGEAVLQSLISGGKAQTRAASSAIAKIFLDVMVAFLP